MQQIDIKNWKGKKHYQWFIQYPIHYYNVTSRIDITTFMTFIKKNKLPFFISFLFLIHQALNGIEEFRLRVRNGTVVLYDVIHPAYTVMTKDGIYDNCENEHDDDFPTFFKKATQAIDIAKQGLREDKPYNDLNRMDQFFYSSLPWIDYTGCSHPMVHDDTAFVPRILWGKYQQIGDKFEIALSIQVSHALVDGYPLSLGFMKIQEKMYHPEKYIVL